MPRIYSMFVANKIAVKNACGMQENEEFNGSTSVLNAAQGRAGI